MPGLLLCPCLPRELHPCNPYRVTTQQIFAVDEFADVRAQATQAFGRDASYAAQMAVQANTIIGKRYVWMLRTELRKAEKKARTLCEKSGSFVCPASTPCGTGQCKFAEGDLTLIEVDDASGDPKRQQDRPQEGSGPYDLETALPMLGKLRPMTEGVIESLRKKQTMD